MSPTAASRLSGRIPSKSITTSASSAASATSNIGLALSQTSTATAAKTRLSALPSTAYVAAHFSGGSQTAALAYPSLCSGVGSGAKT